MQRPGKLIPLSFVLSLLALSLPAQDSPPASTGADSSATSLKGGHRIVIETEGDPVPQPVFYRARVKAQISVSAESIAQTVDLDVQIFQGEAETISFGLNGPGSVENVAGEKVVSWAVRQQALQRFLDIHVAPGTQDLKAVIELRQPLPALPADTQLMHFAPGGAIGFDSLLTIQYADGIAGKLLQAEGFAPLQVSGSGDQLQSTLGGTLQLRVLRRGAALGPVELSTSRLTGTLLSNGRSLGFQLQGTAVVTEAGATLPLLSGKAAASRIPDDARIRLQLSSGENGPLYELVFTEPGTYPIELNFVAPLSLADGDWRILDFKIAASAVVPIALDGLASELEFHRSQDTIVPTRDGSSWVGFLPASGRFHIRWKDARAVGEGKLFFTTSGLIDTTVGPGLLRQTHQLDYHVLQGELAQIQLRLLGPGEILNVEGAGIVGWRVSDNPPEERRLDVTLAQPLQGRSQIVITSQTPFGAFPVRVEALRLQPEGAIRHSGQVRIRNLGSVRIEPTELEGLAQLAPDQYTGEAVESRQTYVYRFPAAEHAYAIAADRVQPEVNISELVVYRLAESDRMILADIELDIREAGIREWDFRVPDDYSIVSVTGANLADYVAGSEATDGQRNLKILFQDEVQGRQLVSLQLEKNIAAAAGEWNLPRILHPDAESVRGDIGVAGTPGFRLSTASTELLVEKPLSTFPKQIPYLQQAFRIREPGWAATMQIEQLQRSVQSDAFHLYSLSQGAVYGSTVVNYFVTGAPTSEWRLSCPQSLRNVTVDGQDIRTWRREEDTLVVTLHRPVMGAYTLLLTFEEQPDEPDMSFQPGLIAPQDVQSERGYIQVVSPVQVQLESLTVSSELLVLDALELPGEFRLLSSAPALGTWQYTERPFELKLGVTWFQPGTMASQVVEFSEAKSHVSPDGELVTDLVYYVKSRAQQVLRIQLPGDPVRLWAVTVGGQPVTARQADDSTLIPLPGNADPNVPVEVTLRLGKPATDSMLAELTLPVVFAPVLKTQWLVSGDENHVLIPEDGPVRPTEPVLPPSGFSWLAQRNPLPVVLLGLVTLLSVLAARRGLLMQFAGLILLGAAITTAGVLAWQGIQDLAPPAPLKLSLPVLAAGESISVQVASLEAWRVRLSWPGLGLVAAGILSLIVVYWLPRSGTRQFLLVSAFVLISVGILLQGDGGPAFLVWLTFSLTVSLLVPLLRRIQQSLKNLWAKTETTPAADHTRTDNSGAVATTILACLACSLAFFSPRAIAEESLELRAASKLTQQWQLSRSDSRLKAQGSLTIVGRPGDQFLLLQAPAVLTQFEGQGLRLTKLSGPDAQARYVVTIPYPDQEPATQDGADQATAAEASDLLDSSSAEAESARREPAALQEYSASFEYLVEAVRPATGIDVLTGPAAVQELELIYDEADWEIACETAARIELKAGENATQAEILLGPGPARIFVRPQVRDLSKEETQFFVEGSHLYTPGPGVVDGTHRIDVRTSQGRVRELAFVVPAGLTVSNVGGPVESWQFDAESRRLSLQIEATVESNFAVQISTQRGLEPLPAEVDLAPIRVENSDGEVGLIALAFGPDAQPERVDARGLSLVNLGDFDSQLLQGQSAVLHRVYRYGADEGDMTVRAAPVAPEVRALARQVLSFGDERVVLAINFAAEITRAGLFQLSFPLPDGLEVESLTGPALHHWAELTEEGQRRILLHLNGKTLGTHNFQLTLAGPSPVESTEWNVPRFVLDQATRQTGDLVVRPITGIRLRTVSRQNASEVDPRTLGGQGQGALAFRLLQRDWDLALGIEQLEPWVTGQVLQEVFIREGQTRTTVLADLNIENASIRTLQVRLPITDADELRTLRASGANVADLVRTSPESDVWELQFQRRLIGHAQFQLEYERRGDRAVTRQDVVPAAFPGINQLATFVSVRAGGRLEIETPADAPGWQAIDWNSVPQALREAGNRNAPALALRANAPSEPLRLQAVRHALADALKLRVAEGTLTTVLSPTGDQLTAVEVTLEVIQRSSLSVQLPSGGELFSIFVNGESVHSVHRGGDQNLWQFTVLPGIDDRTAQVRFVYSLQGDGLDELALVSPELDVPLENVRWDVIAPIGFELLDYEGNLEWIGEDLREDYDRDSYLSKARGRRQSQAEQATQLLEQANQLLQAGQQTKAKWALNSVANQYALDAASNEDARVQLENLQTQQAIVGLNTRRQRLYLDNNRGDESLPGNEQLSQAASANPILQQDKLNFRPQQLSQLLAGNTSDDNAVLQQIAGRLVQHQRTTEPAPQAILISMPEEGTVYHFSRGVQVNENTPLQLDLQFAARDQLHPWQWALIIGLLLALALSLRLVLPRRAPVAE